MLVRKFLALGLALHLALIPAAAHAQSAQLGPGQVLGNSTAGQRPAGAATLPALFDRAYCNTVGYLLVRYVGAWTCSASIALNPVWLGADPLAIIDSAPFINSALLLSSNVQLPKGSFKLASCVNNAIIDYSPTAIRDHTATLSGVNGGAALAGDGTRLILDPSILNTCSVIRRAGTSFVSGTTLRDLTIIPSTGYYGAGVGLHCIFIDGTGQPDYFEYNLKIERVFCGNMAAGQSIKTFASPNASIVAGISTTTMTVSSVSSGAIFVGSNLVNVSGVTIGKVTALGSGTGGTGTYTISPSQTVAPGTALIALGNNGGGALNNASIEHSILMSVNMKNVGDSIQFSHDIVGQNELRGDPGYRWDQVSGAASVRIHGGLIGSVNGMVVVDGGTFPSITGNVELEMSNVANSQGCLIDFTGATTQVVGGLVGGISISQNSSVGTIYPICVRNADNIIVVSNRISTTAATPVHLLNTSASTNLSFNGNFCSTNSVSVDCSATNSSGSINSQKVNLGTANGTDLLNVGGFISVSGIHGVNGSGGIYSISVPPTGTGVTGSFRFGTGTTDLLSTGGTNQILQQPTSGGPITVGTMATTINGVAINVGAGGTITAAPSGTAGGSLAGSYPTPTLTAIISAGGPTGNATTVPQITWTNEGRLSAVTPVTIQLPVANGGTGCVAASGTCLDNITGFSANGLIARTGAGNYAARTATGTANEITVTNGDGVSGNPTLSLPAALTFTGKTVTGGTFANVAMTAPALGTPASGVATNLTGTAAGLTAGNATNGSTVATSTNASFFPLFAASSTNSNQPFNLDTTFTYNPSTDTLTATNFAGNASTATTASAVAASALTGSTLAAGVTGSSLTSVGTLTGGATGAGFTIALGTSTVTSTLPCANHPALTGDVTTSAGSCATAIGATKVTSAMLNADVFSTAHSWAGIQTFATPVINGLATGTGVASAATASTLVARDVSGGITGAIGSFSSATVSGNADFGTAVAAGATGTFSFNGGTSAGFGPLLQLRAGTTPITYFTNMNVLTGNTSNDLAIQSLSGLGIHFFTNASTTERLLITSAGLVQMPSLGSDAATTDNTVCVGSTGTILKGSGTLGICLGTSGRQFKTGFVPMGAGLDEIAALPLWNYRYRHGYGDGGTRIQYGLTAQDVALVLPDLVHYDAEGEAINYDIGAFLPIALHAIQQLKAEIAQIRTEVGPRQQLQKPASNLQ